jgi:hypothetical protein
MVEEHTQKNLWSEASNVRFLSRACGIGMTMANIADVSRARIVVDIDGQESSRAKDR